MESSTVDDSTLLTSETENGGNVTNYDAIFGEHTTNNKKYVKPVPVIGNIRNPTRFTAVEWTFFALSLIAFLGTSAITIERFIHFKRADYNWTVNGSVPDDIDLEECDDWRCTSDFIYTVLLLTNIIFLFFYAVDGVFRERGFELLAVPAAIGIVVVYIVGNYIYQTDERKDWLRITRLVLSLLFGPALAFMAIWIYVRNGRLQFNLVGSNKVLMRVYRIRSFAATLLTFNLHLLANFVILTMSRQRTFIDDAERIVIIVFMIYIIVLTPVGWIGFNYEILPLTILFGAFFSPTVAYYIYKIIDVARDIDNYWAYVNQYEMFKFIALTLFFVSALGIVAYALVMIFTVLVARDFNKGYNNKVAPPFKSCFTKLMGEERCYDATFVATAT